jgi:hypothetical protein
MKLWSKKKATSASSSSPYKEHADRHQNVDFVVMQDLRKVERNDFERLCSTIIDSACRRNSQAYSECSRGGSNRQWNANVTDDTRAASREQQDSIKKKRRRQGGKNEEDHEHQLKKKKKNTDEHGRKDEKASSSHVRGEEGGHNYTLCSIRN